MQIKRVDGLGRALCGNQRVDAKEGIIMYKLKGWMDKGGHYHVEMKRWMDKGGNYDMQMKGWMQQGPRCAN